MKKSISIIGGGAAALLTAAFLDPTKFEVTIYEKNKALGRKLLVAGNGGFNLTHSEPIDQLINRYTPNAFLKSALLHFSNEDLRTWLNNIGIPTFIGSSKRIYPEQGIKPIAVLDAILKELNKRGVKICYNHQWKGWNNKQELVFNTDTLVKSDVVIFALGGGSWKVTGSNSDWLDLFQQKNITTLPFQASNCGFAVNWKDSFITQHEGSPLKNIAITCSNSQQKGEVVITRFGLEGNAIYALSPQIRKELATTQQATIYIDFKPTLRSADILSKLQQNANKNITDTLRQTLKLSAAQIGLLKTVLKKEEYLDLSLLAVNIKKLPLPITTAASIDEAISTVGGIALTEIDTYFQLKNLPNHYCIGEMLDYDAPTGGYLLQACFSMGVFVANSLNKELT